MDYFLNHLADVHKYVWAIILVCLIHVSRRIRALELTTAVLVARVGILLEGHRIEEKGSDESLFL